MLTRQGRAGATVLNPVRSDPLVDNNRATPCQIPSFVPTNSVAMDTPHHYLNTPLHTQNEALTEPASYENTIRRRHHSARQYRDFHSWLIGEQRGTHTSSAVEATHPLAFPDDFDWGVAVAAQHVEHQQPSDWTAFERRVIAESKTGTGDKPGQAKPGHIRDLDKYSAEVRLKSRLRRPLRE